MQCRHTRRQWLSTHRRRALRRMAGRCARSRAPRRRPPLRWPSHGARRITPQRAAACARNHVRPIGRIGTAGQGQDRRHEDQSDRRAHVSHRLPSARRYALHQPVRDRRRRSPHGQSRRSPDPHSGKSVVHRRSGGRIRDASQLGAARYSGRRAERGVRKYQLPGTREEIFAHGSAPMAAISIRHST